ncbi:MAG: hypothetical protein K0S41_2708 [Anaerocolumna sp.]|jgi:hypothetical protein|nr:hypothetical protein [Anaerocolumna sp.]
MDAKILAYYLPQFHEIPENNKWWGKGFTEWVNVKKAESLYEDHYQPRIPIENGYYDLSDVDVMRWQAGIAKENNVYGFCFYHYWFSDKPLLEKPLINWLNAPDIDLPYCFCWANESWTNGWAKAESTVIMEQKYGDKEEWRRHFDFLLPFFKDKRYIIEDGMPLIVIYRPYLCGCIIEMLDYWKELAKENGFIGLKIASQRFENVDNHKDVFNYLDYHIEYQPGHISSVNIEKISVIKKIKEDFHDFLLNKFNIDISFRQKKFGPMKRDYDDAWNKILNYDPVDPKAIAGAFVDWDNTPRYQRRGTVYVGGTPKKFESYLKRQIKHVETKYNNNYVFLFAWNEWGEGGYLEPDKKNGYAYLNAVKNAQGNHD